MSAWLEDTRLVKELLGELAAEGVKVPSGLVRAMAHQSDGWVHYHVDIHRPSPPYPQGTHFSARLAIIEPVANNLAELRAALKLGLHDDIWKSLRKSEPRDGPSIAKGYRRRFDS